MSAPLFYLTQLINMKPILLLAALLSATSAFAQVTIDQNRAMAGGITPGDTPGFPISITQPGSYKLMSNLTVPANTNGIEISVDNVTIDLNGFTLSGPVNCSGSGGAQMVCDVASGYGITYGAPAGNSKRGWTVRNGTVTGFGKNGVELGEGGLAEALRVMGVGGHGILVGQNSVVGNSEFLRNGGRGIYSGLSGVLIHHVTASENRYGGIFTINGSTVQNAVASFNGGYGIQGGSVSSSVMVQNSSGNYVGGYSAGNNICNSAAC